MILPVYSFYRLHTLLCSSTGDKCNLYGLSYLTNQIKPSSCIAVYISRN
jgi:hypothetical protein